MKISPLAGKPAPAAMLVDVSRLLTAYYTDTPDPSVPAQLVAFGMVGPNHQRPKVSVSPSWGEIGPGDKIPGRAWTL